ncbi:MAG: hypothetical protein KGQ57_11830, partial [Burkholderiales bacterium]|nr:hypothetical protein [Burkholderiales bacterium]
SAMLACSERKPTRAGRKSPWPAIAGYGARGACAGRAAGRRTTQQRSQQQAARARTTAQRGEDGAQPRAEQPATMMVGSDGRGFAA